MTFDEMAARLRAYDAATARISGHLGRAEHSRDLVERGRADGLRWALDVIAYALDNPPEAAQPALAEQFAELADTVACLRVEQDDLERQDRRRVRILRQIIGGPDAGDVIDYAAELIGPLGSILREDAVTTLENLLELARSQRAALARLDAQRRPSTQVPDDVTAPVAVARFAGLRARCEHVEDDDRPL